MSNITGRERIALARRRYRRTSGAGSAIRILALIIAANVTLSILATNVVGIAHRDWWRAMPPIGGGTAFLLVSLLMLMGAIVGALSKILGALL